MNDRQRQMKRRGTKATPRYAGGGLIQGVSSGIERVGRFFGTEKAKKIAEADASLKQGQGAIEEYSAPKKTIGVRRAADIEAAEQKALGYRNGGKVRRY